METINGQQLLIDLVRLDKSVCLNGSAWKDAFISTGESLGLQVISSHVHIFEPPKSLGITAYVLLDSSHFSVHTYAESNRAAVDLFACTNGDLSRAFEMICEALGIEEDNIAMVKEVRRFTDSEISEN